MNDAGRIPADGLLTTADLAAMSDFTLGLAAVSPSSRTITGPGGTADVEPRVMQVLVVLADAAGQVVTRATLFERCWGGVYVGDDSLNRAIAGVRKLASDVGGGSFEVETIPRTGYRLTGELSSPTGPVGGATGEKPDAGISRRVMIGSAIGLAAAGAAGFATWSDRSRDARFRQLVNSGEAQLEYGAGSTGAADDLRQAVAIRPDDARAQGLLAYALMTNRARINKVAVGGSVEEAQNAVNTALSLDLREPNARLAQIELQRTTLDFAEAEDRLRAVLAEAPENIFAMQSLWNLLQSTGRSRDGLSVVQRAMAIKPLAATVNYPLAQFLWITGRTAEADRVIDRALEAWPNHPWVRFARFTIFAFTGRPRAALAMLENDETRPQGFTPAQVAVYRVSLAAIDQPSAANIAKARATNLDAVKRDPQTHTPQALLSLCALRDVDAAFEVANYRLVFRNPAPPRSSDRQREPHANSTAWPFTPFLFTPPLAPMRADPRFKSLADGIGLTAYWTKRGIKPDYQVYG